MNSAQLSECAMIVALARQAADYLNEAANRHGLSILPLRGLYENATQAAHIATVHAGMLSAATLKLYIDFESDQALAQACMDSDIRAAHQLLIDGK